jgi:hypothetical protein
MRRVEQVCIRSGFQRRRRATAVAGITTADVLENLGDVNALTFALDLGGAAAGAHLGAGGHEDFHLGIRENHGAYVTAIEYSTRGLASEFALKCEQGRAHLRNGGDDGGGLTDRMPLELGGIKPGRIKGGSD